MNRDGKLDLMLKFRMGDTNLRDLYSNLLLADAGDGKRDSTRQQTKMRLTGSTTDGKLWAAGIGAFLSRRNSACQPDSCFSTVITEITMALL